MRVDMDQVIIIVAIHLLLQVHGIAQIIKTYGDEKIYQILINIDSDHVLHDTMFQQLGNGIEHIHCLQNGKKQKNEWNIVMGYGIVLKLNFHCLLLVN